MSKSRGSPRKFAEKIALLNKKEAEGTSEFEKILKEVKESTRTPSNPQQYWGLPQRSASFSNWETFGPLGQQPQYDNQHLNGARYLSATQHVQYPSHPNQLQQTRQHVIATTRQQPNQAHHIAQHLSQQQRLQPTIYVDRQGGSPDEFMQTSGEDQQASRRSSYVRTTPAQPISIEVPNIAIFPTDDDYQQHQLNVGPPTTTSAATHNTLGDGHYRNDCSNSPISLSRSLPNIANLTVSQPPTGQLPVQPLMSQRLDPTFSGENHNLKQSATPAATVASNTSNNNNDCYLPSANSRTEYFSNDEYCSLPSFQPPLAAAIDRRDQNRQSRPHIPPSDSWQQFPMGSAPSSAAPTPPGGIVQDSPYISGQQQSPQQQLVHSPDSSPHRQQQSPQMLHQDYYPSLVQAQQGPLTRANSTDVINKYPNNTVMLEAPRINGNLSKSTEAHYGSYLDTYTGDEGFSNDNIDGNREYSNNNHYLDANNSSSPIARSRSENNIDNMSSPNDYPYTDQYADTSQQFLNTPRCEFYE